MENHIKVCNKYLKTDLEIKYNQKYKKGWFRRCWRR